MMTVVTAADIQITNLGWSRRLPTAAPVSPLCGDRRRPPNWPVNTSWVSPPAGTPTHDGADSRPLAVLLPDMATVLAQQCTESDVPSS
ncbi:hypothetical protein NKH18_13340 [Streptomyces sp. M10(2022)]